MKPLTEFARLSLFASIFAVAAHAVPIVYTTDFITDATRTGFNGFESIPTDATGSYYTGGWGPYTENGIEVSQINELVSTSTSIWVNDWTVASPATAQGKSWYPNGGDHGYTQIRMNDGSDFVDVGFRVLSGGDSSLVLFDLFDDGNLVLSGSVPFSFGSNRVGGYLGFSGGGFDEIHVRDNTFYPGYGENQNALNIDSIETQGTSGTPPGASVPDSSSTIAMLAGALLGLATLRRLFLI